MNRKVILTHHAYDRYLEYRGRIKREELTRLVHSAMFSQLRVGIPYVSGALQVRIEKGLYAAVAIEMSGYVVITIHKGENYAKHKAGRYGSKNMDT